MDSDCLNAAERANDFHTSLFTNLMAIHTLGGVQTQDLWLHKHQVAHFTPEAIAAHNSQFRKKL